jgi:hypothetical protein
MKIKPLLSVIIGYSGGMLTGLSFAMHAELYSTAGIFIMFVAGLLCQL